MQYYSYENICDAFGNDISYENVNEWINKWRGIQNNFILLLIISGTRTAEINGISSAGSTPESRRYTAIADAELLIQGPEGSRKWPLPPLPGGVSPALISFVSAKKIRVRPTVLSVGLIQKPPFPHILVEPNNKGQSCCVSTGKAMSIDRVDSLWDKGFQIGRNLQKPILLAESVPGGTTTAQAVLRGLGLQIDHLVSGSVKNPPKNLKTQLIDRGLRKANLSINPSPQEILSAVGDPFQPVAVGLLLGANQSGIPILLGGGCQMLAILALALSATDPSLRKEFVGNIAVATTSWLVKELMHRGKKESPFINLLGIISTYFEVNILGLSSGLSFEKSNIKVLRDYEYGYVKEGVGAGALSLLAALNGASQEEMIFACEECVSKIKI